MPKSTFASQAVSRPPRTKAVRVNRTGRNGVAQMSGAKWVEDLETRLTGMLEALDTQFERIVELQTRVAPLGRKQRQRVG